MGKNKLKRLSLTLFNMVELARTVIVAARFRKEDRELLKQICEARGEDLSSFVRRAVRREFARLSYLSAEEKKALEIH